VDNGSEVRSIDVRSIEIRYSGVVVGRSTKVRDWDTAGAFIGFAEPLPSGTALVLRGDGIDQAARVVEVFESADPAVAGMQVKFIGSAEAARPAPRPAAPAARATAAAPEPARAPEPAIVNPSAATTAAAPAPIAVVAEASPVEASEAPSSVAVAEPGDGESGQAEQSGQAGSGGKRRRRRR
jgi:hypothetical protein